jgi:hypothetical protein
MLKSLSPYPEIVGSNEVGEIPFELFVIVVVERLDVRFLDRSEPIGVNAAGNDHAVPTFG